MPNFNVQQPPPFDPLAQRQKQATLSGMLSENALRQQLAPLQVQEQQQKVQQATTQNQLQQLELQSQQGIIKAFSNPDFVKKVSATDTTAPGGAGFDPDAMINELTTNYGVQPQQAQAVVDHYLKRSQTLAEIAKTNAQAGEAQSAMRDKGYKLLADKIGSVLDTPAAKAKDAMTALAQDLVKNQKSYAGVPQDDLAHIFQAATAGDIEKLQAAAGGIGLDAKIADFHKSKQEAVNATPEGAAAKSSAEAKAKLAVEGSPEALALAGNKAKIEANARQQAAQGDPKVAGKMLADGSLTLADLKTRGTTPQFIEQATAEAQKLDPKYNPADEMIAEHVAKSGTANQFFGSANSLITKGGTLDQLEAQGKKIPEHDLPVLNTIDDWQKVARGKGPLAGYAATALGVADDYGKVMGGGNASDHARDAALQLFAKAASPEQRADAIQSTRDAVQSQRDSRIGNNQFMKRQYGAEVSKGAGAEATGHVIAIGDKNYQYKGSGDTADLKNYTEVKKP